MRRAPLSGIVFVVGFLVAVAVLFLVWFSGVLCRRLGAPFLLAAGSLTGGLLLAADALWASTAATVQHESSFVLDPNAHLLLEDAGFVLFVASMLGALVLVAATSAAVLRTGELPRLVGYCGFAVAASLAASWYYLPVFALLAWVAAVSLLLTFSRRPPAPRLRG